MRYASMIVAAFAVAATLVAEPVEKAGFQRPPTAALKALKASIGKQFNAGWVFIDGKYLAPPYKVERYGNAIRINGIQVTGEIVPWSAFIRTQKGVKVTRSESAPAAGEEAPAAEPEPEEPSIDDAWESSLDDLFDDEPVAKKPAKKATHAAKPRPKKPSVTVSYSFEGEFEHNEQTKSMLARINALRTKIDGNLRRGGLYCFSSRYSMVAMDSRSARHVLDSLPAIMKQNTDRDSFSQAVHAANIPFSEPLIDDVFKNRFDYLRINDRYNKEKDGALWR